MNRQQALECMVMPSQHRPGKPLGGVLQIWVTRACEGHCNNCTQGANLAGKGEFISLRLFEEACKSLVGYFGIIGLIGGNPCLHPQFDVLCDILSYYFPREQCGLWSNNLCGHGKDCRRVFNPAVSNLNVHGNLRAHREIRKTWPEARPFGLTQRSSHSPPYIALQDLVDDEEVRWDLISRCDINQHWSAMVAPFRGELRGYFCEIAAAQAVLHQQEPDYPDLGLPIARGWWKQPLEKFTPQIDYHCLACGVPLRIIGSIDVDNDGMSYTTKTHAGVYKPKRPQQQIRLVESLAELGPQLTHRMTDYLGNAKRKAST